MSACTASSLPEAGDLRGLREVVREGRHERGHGASSRVESVAAPRRFAYYERLAPREKAIYRRSDAISALVLPDVGALAPLVVDLELALSTSKRTRVAAATRAFAQALLDQVGAPPVRIHVREVRPQFDGGELHGLYTFATDDTGPKLEVWMRTAAQAKTVKFKTFLRTLLHELLHHVDVTLLELEESFHTEGFFRRESSLVRQLLGVPPKAPRPVQGSLF